LIETFCRLEVNATELKHMISEGNKRFRDALDKQFQLILNGTQSGFWATTDGAVLRDRIHEPLDEQQGRTQQAQR
jgi:hypothetical protein